MFKPRLVRTLVSIAIALPSLAAQADNPVNGASLYNGQCAGCHGASPLTSNSKKIYNGRNSRSAIDDGIANVGEMNSLRGAFPSGGTALADVAAYLGNAPTSLGFGATAVGASSAAQMVTVYASLKSGRAISAMTVATTGDFTRSGGTCGTAVATGTSCTVGVVFSPTAAGTRNGTLTLGHNNTLTPISIALSGTANGAVQTAPVASIAPASLAFGSTAIGATSAVQNITVGNTGNAALTLGAISYGSAEFQTAGGTCTAPGTVAAGSSCTLSVAFRPAAGAAGTRSGSLSITHNAAGSPGVVNLSGTAAAAATPAASLTSSLGFGSVNVGGSSAVQTATLSNSGGAALAIASIGSGSAEFVVVGGSCAAGGTVAAGSNCTIDLSFRPSAAGARSASLTVAHNAAGGGSSSALSGTGVASSPAVSVSPTSLSFSQTVASTSVAQTVTVSNTGTAALSLTSLTLTGAQASEFQIAGGGTCSAGSSVAASASCTVRIAFAPTAVGARSATLAITHNAAASPTSVALAGSGTATPQPSIALDASALSFSAQTVATTSTAQSVTVTNSGAATLTLAAFTATGSAAADFARGGTCAANGTLVPGATCTVTHTFTPAATGSRTATLTIASDAGNGSAVLSLSGSGAALATPAVGLAPASLDFGNQTLAMASSARTVVLGNSGSGALALSAITASGGFAVTHNCGSSVPAAGSCNLAVTFTPTALGSASGTVSIASNAAGSPHRVTLAGNGVTAAPALAWSPAVTSLDFGSSSIGNSATAQPLNLVNQGPGAVSLQQLTLAGVHASDFVFAAGSTCAANLVLAQGASCALAIGFQPGAAGARSAALQVASNGSNPPDVALAGIGSTTAQAAASLTPGALTFSAAANTAADAQELVLQSSGSSVLHVDAIRIAAGSFTLAPASAQACQATPFDLMPGQSCRVAVSWSSTQAGAETGSVELDTNAAATPLSVPIAAARESAAAAGMSNVGGGGCSIAGRGGAADPTLWILVALALLVLWRRRA